MKHTSCLASLKAYFQQLYQQYNRAFVVLFLGFSVMGCGNKVVRQGAAGSGTGDDSTITTGGGGTTTTDDDPVVDNRIFDVGAPFNPPNINPYFNGLQAPPLSQGYRALATLLLNSYLLTGSGLNFDHEVGRFDVVGNRLVPTEDAHKNVALSNLGLSLRHTYLGSTVFANVANNAFGGLFADHHNPNATDHCWNSCELIHKNGSYYVRILSRFGTTELTLVEQQVNQGSGFLECVNYHETIVAYLDGKYIGAAKDPFETEKNSSNLDSSGNLLSHAGLFGFRARDGEFGSAVVANINAIPASVLVVFYDDFQTSSGSSLGPAWNFSSIQQQGGLAVSSSTSTARLADTDVEDADVIIEYNLLASGASVGVSARSSIEAQATLDGSNLRLTLRKNGSVLSTQDLGAVGTTGYLRIRVKDARIEVFQHFDYVPLMQSTPILTANLSSSEWNESRAGNSVIGTGSLQKGSVGMLISANAQVNQFLYLEPNGPSDR